MTNRNYNSPRVDAEWAATRETCIAVATAIHAIADSKRSADAIWEAPTQAEEDHVKMAVQEYLNHGDFPRDPDGEYGWGASTLHIE